MNIDLILDILNKYIYYQKNLCLNIEIFVFKTIFLLIKFVLNRFVKITYFRSSCGIYLSQFQ